MNCTVCKWEGSVYNLKNAKCENGVRLIGGLYTFHNISIIFFYLPTILLIALASIEK